MPEHSRKNIAIIGVGFFSSGPADPGVPSMINVITTLSKKFSITVYSFIPVNKATVPDDVRIRCISQRRISLKVRYAMLVFQFITDHVSKKFDLIHAQSPYPAGVMSFWLNKFFKIPWILFLDGAETICLPGVPYGDLLNPRLKKAAIQVFPQAKHIVALTKFQADLTRQSLNLEREISVLHRGINVPPYQDKVLSFPIRFIHISNFHPIKDYETLMKTFSIVRSKIPCELMIVGKQNTNALQEIITSLGIGERIKFLGQIPNHTLSEIFSTQHILLHTSIYESMGMVVVEAMAHGVVVAGTKVGIMADASEWCLTVNPGEYDELAAKILYVVDNDTRFQQLREQAYNWVRKHDLPWHVHELESLYASAMLRD